MQTRHIFECWDNARKMAEALELDYNMVRQWRTRGIPQRWWERVIVAARDQGLHISWHQMKQAQQQTRKDLARIYIEPVSYRVRRDALIK